MSAFVTLSACDTGPGDPDVDSGITGGDDAATRPDGSTGGCDIGGGECPCAMLPHAGSNYLFCPDAIDWDTAGDRCRTFGYELVRIDNEAEQDFIYSTAVDRFGGGAYWIGLNDRDEEGAFVWPGGAALGGFAPWAPEQPNNGGAEGSIEEDCVELNHDVGGLWNDLACDTDFLSYLCEARM